MALLSTNPIAAATPLKTLAQALRDHIIAATRPAPVDAEKLRAAKERREAARLAADRLMRC